MIVTAVVISMWAGEVSAGGRGVDTAYAMELLGEHERIVETARVDEKVIGYFSEPRDEDVLPGAIIDISGKCGDYRGVKMALSEEDRKLLEGIVMGEAGGEGFTGAALVAQAIRDTMVTDGFTVREVWKNLKYTNNVGKIPNDNVVDAVKFIFDDGGMAVQHRIIYFYAPRLVRSGFHESQKFVVEYGCHRMFDRWD